MTFLLAFFVLSLESATWPRSDFNFNVDFDPEIAQKNVIAVGKVLMALLKEPEIKEKWDDRSNFIAPLTVKEVGEQLTSVHSHKTDRGRYSHDGATIWSILNEKDLRPIEKIFINKLLTPSEVKAIASGCIKISDKKSTLGYPKVYRFWELHPKAIYSALSMLVCKGFRASDLHESSSFCRQMQIDFAICGVRFYTSQREHGGCYREINQQIQCDGENPAATTVMMGFRYLHHNCKEKFVTNIPRTVWRGMKKLTDEQWENFEVGSSFYWASFVSTTEDLNVARAFTQNDPDEKGALSLEESALFEITLNGDNSYVLKLTEELTMFPKEKEVLLYPYHRFRIKRRGGPISVDNFRGRGIIEIEVLDCALRAEKIVRKEHWGGKIEYKWGIDQDIGGYVPFDYTKKNSGSTSTSSSAEKKVQNESVGAVAPMAKSKATQTNASTSSKYVGQRDPTWFTGF